MSFPNNGPLSGTHRQSITRSDLNQYIQATLSNIVTEVKHEQSKLMLNGQSLNLINSGVKNEPRIIDVGDKVENGAPVNPDNIFAPEKPRLKQLASKCWQGIKAGLQGIKARLQGMGNAFSRLPAIVADLFRGKEKPVSKGEVLDRDTKSKDFETSLVEKQKNVTDKQTVNVNNGPSPSELNKLAGYYAGIIDEIKNATVSHNSTQDLKLKQEMKAIINDRLGILTSDQYGDDSIKSTFATESIKHLENWFGWYMDF